MEGINRKNFNQITSIPTSKKKNSKKKEFKDQRLKNTQLNNGKVFSDFHMCTNRT